MNDLIFCITTPDQTVINRWQSAFKHEGWEVNACDSLNAPCADAGCAEVYLVEVGTPLCKTPEDLQEIIKTRKPVAVLAFAAAENISNPQIARFLEAGADDFVFKNLDERILVAKLKAHIRRLTPAIAQTMSKLASSSGNMEIDRGRRSVRIEAAPGKYTELTNLTQKEFEILSVLVGSEKRVVSRESILEKLWGKGAADVNPECVDKHIESLRKKLGPCGKSIKTVYGSGYMFTESRKG
ncbi:MAG: response regulator transcription factor [Elusimicrobiota bacterium]|nr:response regulator transcription factor [Elusimicrobiota bacterium]